jgi:hypothetical protein
MKFRVLTAMDITSTLPCDVTPCSLLDKYQYFEGNVLKLQIIPFRDSTYFTIYVYSIICVGVVVINILVFTVFCIVCTVLFVFSFMYIYSNFVLSVLV